MGVLGGRSPPSIFTGKIFSIHSIYSIHSYAFFRVAPGYAFSRVAPGFAFSRVAPGYAYTRVAPGFHQEGSMLFAKLRS